jgi:hypothetical protein
MKIEDLIKYWDKFAQEWRNNPKNQVVVDGVTMHHKPQFFDFMEYLSDNYGK